MRLKVIEGGGAGELVQLLERALEQARSGELKAVAFVAVDTDYDPTIWRGWSGTGDEPMQPLIYGLDMLRYRLLQKTDATCRVIAGEG